MRRLALMPTFAAAVTDWYAVAARDLPWRRKDASPWAVLVSEIMLAQTPVARVLPVYQRWLVRWPLPAALAAEAPGAAVRMWGRLGYPRRALRLHEIAVALVERHAGQVPADLDALLALPGVGSYTARAVASFAFGQRHAVVDTNVRRVLTRAVTGRPDPGPPSPVRDLALAEPLLPAAAPAAATYAAAVMELGALVCTARAPRCPACPVAGGCAWRAAGHPPGDETPRRRPGYAGTDRQVRGRLLALIGDSLRPLAPSELACAWDETAQRDRALATLIADGLIAVHPDGRVGLAG